MTINFYTPSELAVQIAAAVKAKRLSLNLSQQSVAERAGLSLGTLKKFESSGKISFNALLNLALVLGNLEDFTALFQPPPPERFNSLDELLKQKNRQRGRK